VRRERDLRITRFAPLRERISLELCGRCHRAPGSVDVSDPVNAAQLARFQAQALSMSACFRKSEARLSCVTCHDPHRDAEPAASTGYNRRCAGCHAAAGLPVPFRRRSCPVAPRGDCVACHMPVQEVAMPSRPRFRTHWIKVWEKTAPAGGGGDRQGSARTTPGQGHP
jgi:hypothetical protein